MKYTSTILACGLAMLAGPAFAAPDLSRLPAPATQQGVTYAKDIRPLFEASCFRCHGSERQKGDLRLDSLEAIMKGGKDGDVVVPGKSDKSDLVIAVAQIDDDTAMPPKKVRAEDVVRVDPEEEDPEEEDPEEEDPEEEDRVEVDPAALEDKCLEDRLSRRASRAVAGRISAAQAEGLADLAAALEALGDPEAGAGRHPSL